MQRFDANSYLTITRAMDYFDVAADCGGDLAAAFKGTQTRFLLASFTSDWLFPTSASRAIARALNRAGANVSFVEFPTDKGHDAFLLDEPDFHRTWPGSCGAAPCMLAYLHEDGRHDDARPDPFPRQEHAGRFGLDRWYDRTGIARAGHRLW